MALIQEAQHQDGEFKQQDPPEQLYQNHHQHIMLEVDQNRKRKDEEEEDFMM